MNVSSIQHLVGSDFRLALDKTCPPSMWCSGSFVYGDTKLAVNYWTKSLAQKLQGTGRLGSSLFGMRSADTMFQRGSIQFKSFLFANKWDLLKSFGHNTK